MSLIKHNNTCLCQSFVTHFRVLSQYQCYVFKMHVIQLKIELNLFFYIYIFKKILKILVIWECVF
jgi:hypothetical protein